MAYKQNPGRSPLLKTGNGIPSALRQDKGIELTERYTKGVKKYKEQRNKGNVDSSLNVDATTGFAAAKPYEKRFVPNKVTNGASIIGGDNKTVATATSYGQGREVENLRKRFVSDSTNTMNDRKRKADLYNAFGGGTSPDKLSESQKKSLVSTSKAIRAR